MRHLYHKAHLNRTASHRKALFGNLSAALFTNKRIITTLGKAKYARQFAERMITFARSGDVADRRHVLRFIRDKQAVKVLFDELGPHFKNRNGGYTRIIKLGSRRGDAAPMAILELVGFGDIASSDTKKETKSRLKASQKKVVKEKLDQAPEEVKAEVATEPTPEVTEESAPETKAEPVAEVKAEEEADSPAEAKPEPEATEESEPKKES